MGETVTLLEHRVRKVVERLETLDAERARLARELEALRGQDEGRNRVLADAAQALYALARELGEERAGEGA